MQNSTQAAAEAEVYIGKSTAAFGLTLQDNFHLSIWKEYKTPEGRVYFYNTSTKNTTWEKPDELKTSEERALSTTAWKEYVAENGRMYYYNTVTKETTWNRPSTLQSPPSSITPSSTVTTDHSLSRSPQAPDQLAETAKISVATLKTPEAQREAFWALLRNAGVQPNWSWEQAMRATINHPHYRALQTVADRKQAFEAYCENLAKNLARWERKELEKKERALENFLHQRYTIENLPETYHDAEEELRTQREFTKVPSHKRRREVYERFSTALQQKFKEEAQQQRQETIRYLTKLLRACPDITVTTSWQELPRLLERLATEHDDFRLQDVDRHELLTAFQQHMDVLYQDIIDWKEKQELEIHRVAHKARDHFQELLSEYQAVHGITMHSTWSEFFQTVADDPRLKDLLGQPGSTPQQLFWDEVEKHRDYVYRCRRKLDKRFEETGFSLTPDTSLSEFNSAAKVVADKLGIKDSDLYLVYQKMHASAVRIHEEMLRKQEKRQRAKEEDFRYFLKRFVPRLLPHQSWDEVRELLSNSVEYKLLDTDAQREAVYRKFQDEIRNHRSEVVDSGHPHLITKQDLSLMNIVSTTGQPSEINSHDTSLSIDIEEGEMVD
ncbi:U1 snRNP protein [Dispira simplex]|nr:U1 snRNP protein [Dispira simplex]